ncbi:hypothetical protein DUNSADRAFT_8785, partial [Dunaliella salina]
MQYLMGGVLIVNLILAIIYVNYQKQQNEKLERMEREMSTAGGPKQKTAFSRTKSHQSRASMSASKKGSKKLGGVSRKGTKKFGSATRMGSGVGSRKPSLDSMKAAGGMKMTGSMGKAIGEGVEGLQGEEDLAAAHVGVRAGHLDGNVSAAAAAAASEPGARKKGGRGGAQGAHSSSNGSGDGTSGFGSDSEGGDSGSSSNSSLADMALALPQGAEVPDFRAPSRPAQAAHVPRLPLWRLEEVQEQRRHDARAARRNSTGTPPPLPRSHSGQQLLQHTGLSLHAQPTSLPFSATQPSASGAQLQQQQQQQQPYAPQVSIASAGGSLLSPNAPTFRRDSMLQSVRGGSPEEEEEAILALTRGPRPPLAQRSSRSVSPTLSAGSRHDEKMAEVEDEDASPGVLGSMRGALDGFDCDPMQRNVRQEDTLGPPPKARHRRGSVDSATQPERRR